jgi:hypothetical protein
LLRYKVLLAPLGFVAGLALLMFGWRNLADDGIRRIGNRRKGGVIRLCCGLGLIVFGAIASSISLLLPVSG